MQKLYKHQEEFLKKNPDIAIIAWEAGTGKTRAAIEWLKLRPWLKHVLIIVPKAIKEKWRDDLIKWECSVPCRIISKEELKKDQYVCDALIFDEVHHASSPLFIAKKRSQITTAVYNLVKMNPKMPRLLMSANIVRSNPANLHTLLYLSVSQIDWKKWQARFYELKSLPYLPRPAYMPRAGWQKQMVPIIARYCSVALMADCADVPKHAYNVVDIELTKDTKQAVKDLKKNEWEPIRLWISEHRLENGQEKLDWIKNLVEGRRKVVVVCKYLEQIDIYAKELAKVKEVFVLTGKTTDQGKVIGDAQESPECILIVQGQVTAGYDLDSFSTMVFASCSWSWVDHSQAHARINRIHNLHQNEYYYLVAGEKDRAILKSLEEKKDFDINSVIH